MVDDQPLETPRSGDSDSDIVNILIVDDEPKNLTALEAVLSGADRRLMSAQSGEDALRWLLKEQFAVVLLDVRMPDMDGFETARLMRQHHRSQSTPIIFLTAANRESTQINLGYSLGAVDYLLKPFDPTVLQSKVAVFVDLFRKSEQVRRQAEQLAEATSFLQNVLESTAEYAIIATDLEGIVLAWYQGAQRQYGFEADEMVGKGHVRTLFSPDDILAGRVEQLIEWALADGKAEGVFEHVRQDGRRFTAAVTLSQQRDARGMLTGFVLIAKDITQQQLQEERSRMLLAEQVARAEAEAANRRFALLAEASVELARLLDDQSALTRVARLVAGDMATACTIDLLEDGGALRRAAAVHREPMQEDQLASVPAPHLQDGSCSTRVIQSGEGVLLAAITAEALRGLETETKHRRTLRGLHFTSAMVVPIPGRSGVVGTVSFFTSAGAYEKRDLDFAQDLARRVGLALDNMLLYREAQEALRSRDDFFSSTYHDLKTPLAVIKGNAQLLRLRSGKLGDEGQYLVEGLTTIDNATTRMVRFIDEMLDVARMQAGKSLTLKRKPTDLVELVQIGVQQFSHTAGGRHIDVEASDSALVGSWDSVRLERVVNNLLSNAVEYSGEGSRITVRLARESDETGRWAVLTVDDEGIGIPADDLPHVFERYFRARNVAGKIAGTGIGLAGVKQIVDEHGGTIALTSQEGAGTRVSIRLPLAEHLVATPR